METLLALLWAFTPLLIPLLLTSLGITMVVIYLVETKGENRE